MRNCWLVTALALTLGCRSESPAGSVNRLVAALRAHRSLEVQGRADLPAISASLVNDLVTRASDGRASQDSTAFGIFGASLVERLHVDAAEQVATGFASVMGSDRGDHASRLLDGVSISNATVVERFDPNAEVRVLVRTPGRTADTLRVKMELHGQTWQAERIEGLSEVFPDLRANYAHDRLVAETKSDLMNLMTAQESYFSDHGRYATSVQELDSIFTPSYGDTVTIHPVSRASYTAGAKRELSGVSPGYLMCHVSLGAQYPDDGVIACAP